MPTFIFFQGGVEKAKVVGANMGEINRHIATLAAGSGSAGGISISEISTEFALKSIYLSI